MQIFVFRDNWLFEIIVQKGMKKMPFLFERVLRLHELQVEGRLIVHVTHVSGT